MKKRIYLILCISFILLISGCGKKTEVSNPFVEVSNIKEAESLVGFTITVPDKVLDYKDKRISVIENEMIDITYTKKKSKLTIRKGIGTVDISGDYNNYSDINENIIDGVTVTTRGNDNLIFNATWNNDNYTYAIVSNKGIDSGDIVNLVKEIK